MMESSQEAKYIDIRKVFLDKNRRLGSLLPGFVYAYLRKIIHEDEINSLMAREGSKIGPAFLEATIKDFNVKIEVKGLENLPQNRRCVFVSNHPLGGFDGIILLDLLARHYGEVKFLANDILGNIKNLEPMFIPINKHASSSKENAKMLDDYFASSIAIGTFPAGLVSRRIKGVVADLEWKKSFLAKAIQHKRDIVPIHVSGGNSNFFYNLSNFRKRIGIKANIEMFFLPDETFKHKNKTFVVTFGKPISYEVFDKRFSLQGWSQELRKFVYKLASDSQASFITSK